MFLQNRNFSKGIITIILIPPWFQACINWKKFVIWRHHLIHFCDEVSLFHGSTWSNSHVKETVLISQYLLQPSIIINGLQLIREKVEECLFEESHCSPAVFKVAICCTEQVVIIFLWKVVKCAKAITEIPFFHGKPA